VDLTADPQREFQIGQLAQAAQVCGLSQRTTVPSEARILVARADAAKRPLSPDELKIVCKYCGTSEHAVRELMAQSSQLVDEARRRLLNQHPHLVLPGGQLYPEQRAEACWRDCQQFLRVITYGVACDCAEITDKDGMNPLLALYKLVDVPVPALLYALTQMRALTTHLLEGTGHAREIRCLNMAIDDLMKALLPAQTW
jgi:hypothetical protein